MRRLRLLAIPLFLLLLPLLPPTPRVSAQSCGNLLTATFDGTYYYLVIGSLFVPGGSVYWRAGNYNNYEFDHVSGSANIDIHYYDTMEVLIGLMHTVAPAETYVIPVNTAAIAFVSNATFSGYFCNLSNTPTPSNTSTPTDTPIPPTNTPTPTEVVVTVTPSPTPTPNPSIALQERIDQTFSLQVFGFTVILGIAIYFFLRLR